MTNIKPQQRYEIGRVGLGVLTCNLVLKRADQRMGEERLDVPDLFPTGGVADPPEAKV